MRFVFLIPLTLWHGFSKIIPLFCNIRLLWKYYWRCSSHWNCSIYFSTFKYSFPQCPSLGDYLWVQQFVEYVFQFYVCGQNHPLTIHVNCKYNPFISLESFQSLTVIFRSPYTILYVFWIWMRNVNFIVILLWPFTSYLWHLIPWTIPSLLMKQLVFSKLRYPFNYTTKIPNCITIDLGSRGRGGVVEKPSD